MLGFSVTATGGFKAPPPINMTKLHRELGNKQIENIQMRVRDGKTLTGGAMVPSLRVRESGGVTLMDTGEMLNISLNVFTADATKAIVGFGASRTKIAGWNHYGAKTKNGKWRPQPRPFFGFGPHDREVLEKVVSEYLADYAKKANR